MWAADFEYRYDKTLDLNVDDRPEDSDIILAGRELQAAWDELKKKVTEEFQKNDYAPEEVDFRLLYRMQYQGQLNDLEIEAPISSFKSIDDWENLVKTFEETYARVYAKSALSPELGYSITGAIVRGVVEVAKPQIPKEPLYGETPPVEAFLGLREIYWNGSLFKQKFMKWKNCYQVTGFMTFQLLNQQPPHWSFRLGLRHISMKIVFSI